MFVDLQIERTVQVVEESEVGLIILLKAHVQANVGANENLVCVVAHLAVFEAAREERKFSEEKQFF